MRVELMSLDELLKLRHLGNPKAHDIAALASSFRRFGFVAPPTIDEATNTLVAGHGRCEALATMRDAGEDAPDGIEAVEVTPDNDEWYIPVIRDVSFRSSAERDAYLIADNAHVMRGGWDANALQAMLADLRESTEDAFDGLGFDESDLAEFAADTEKAVVDAASAAAGESDTKPPGPTPEEIERRKVAADAAHAKILGLRTRKMTGDDWTIYHGDCLEGLRKLEDNSVDSVVTDPPAGIKLLGNDWDDDKGGRDQWIAWLTDVMREIIRVLKPGAHALIWALPRTSHWTATAVEDAGFEIRDVHHHIFATGYPKSHNVSKAIDVHLGAEREVIGPHEHAGIDTWHEDPQVGNVLGHPVTAEAAAVQGVGTALKPAVEHWVLARKPLIGKIAENVIAYGTGGLNIDECRVGDADTRSLTGRRPEIAEGDSAILQAARAGVMAGSEHGRWPAHLSVDEGAAELLDEQSGTSKSTKNTRGIKGKPGYGFAMTARGTTHDDEGGASRFFYIAKATRAEKSAGLDEANTHPSVKSIELMRWLVRLVTPPGGTVLDAFCGSGTTGVAAIIEGCRFIGFERDPKFHAFACGRIASVVDAPIG